MYHIIQVDTVDESENETAGRGMISNRDIKEGDELFTLPLDLLLTKDAAKKVWPPATKRREMII